MPGATGEELQIIATKIIVVDSNSNYNLNSCSCYLKCSVFSFSTLGGSKVD